MVTKSRNPAIKTRVPAPSPVPATATSTMDTPVLQAAPQAAATVQAAPRVARKRTPATAPAKAFAKPAAKPVAKAAPKATAKPVVKTATKMSTKTASAKSVAKVPAKLAKPEKIKKPKLVRDSFTIPKLEYAVIEQLKQRAAKLGAPIKKSELLRAGIKLLATMGTADYLAALAAVPTIKTGRPAKH